jgi:fructokinase
MMKGRPCIFGEVLFDCFPGGRRVLGGAPFNVAWHLQAFGAAPFFVSRVGADSDGDAIRTGMRGWGMEISGLQADDQLPTGRVQVDIEGGEPSYDIVHPVAWDAIEADSPVPEVSLFYHGSLALREKGSRRAWEKLRGAAPAIVFIDVNLRAPWWQREQVLEDISGADWVKLNRPELDLLAPGQGDPASRAQSFLKSFGLRGLVLTDGPHGAELLTDSGERIASRPSSAVAVVDTVGAGDALAAILVLGLLRGWPLGLSLERAQDFASAIVGQNGATVTDPDFYRAFMNRWQSQQDDTVAPSHNSSGVP